MQATLRGALVRLRPATAADIAALAAIRATPEVYGRWRGGDDLAKSVAEDLDDPETHVLAVEYGRTLTGRRSDKLRGGRTLTGRRSDKLRGGRTLTGRGSDKLRGGRTLTGRDRVVGQVQWGEETDPDYRHASIDIYLDPAVHGRGLGTDAVRTLARYLVTERGHHRVVIDPAADNTAAIRCYAKVGFRPVGIMRRYERGADGTWHDGLLMDLLADELIS